MGKKRSVNQQSERISKGKFEVLFSKWVVNSLENDFGFDYKVRITNESGDGKQEISDHFFLVQNKSSIAIDQENVFEDMKIDDLQLFLSQVVPVLLCKYDVIRDVWYGVIVQDYIWDVIEKVDENWNRKTTKRIKFEKTISDLAILKSQILDSQKRILRYHQLGLGYLEGIHLNEGDLSDIHKHKSRALLEFKELSLHEAWVEMEKGDYESAIKVLNEVYQSPINDVAKIRAIFGLVFIIMDDSPREKLEIIRYSNEGIAIAKKLGEDKFQHYLIILKMEAILWIVNTKIMQVLLSKKISNDSTEDMFSYLYEMEYQKLLEFRAQRLLEMNHSLLKLLESNDIIYFITALSHVVDALTHQIIQYGIFNYKIIEKLRDERPQLIVQMERLLKDDIGEQMRMEISASLANYYYWTCSIDLALKMIDLAIELAKKHGKDKFVAFNEEIKKTWEGKPNPYSRKDKRLTKESSTKEFQEGMKDLMMAQGMDMSGDDHISEAIRLGIKDINPENYFKQCRNLHIKYLTPSPLGANIGLFSLGMKFLWCKYGGGVQALDLEGAYKMFSGKYCAQCEEKSPQIEDWICTIGWVQEQEKDPEFLEILSALQRIPKSAT